MKLLFVLLLTIVASAVVSSSEDYISPAEQPIFVFSAEDDDSTSTSDFVDSFIEDEEDSHVSDVSPKLMSSRQIFLQNLTAAPVCACACTKVDNDYPNLHCSLDGQPVEMDEEAAAGLKCKVSDCPCDCTCDYKSIAGVGDTATVKCLLNKAQVTMATKHMAHFNCKIPDGPKKCNPPCERGTCDTTKGVCNCPWGFKGTTCGNHDCGKVDGKTCNNKGICSPNGTCLCNVPYTGKLCQIIKCPEDCNKNGTCDNVIGKCTCKEGFVLPNCRPSCPKNTKGEECNASGECLGNGTCKCDTGKIGVACTDPECPKVASKICNTPNGSCNSGKCVCVAGYKGDACEIIPCKEKNGLVCNNNGVCKEGKCVCNDKFTGEVCDIPKCSPDCSANATCTPTGCVCKSGFTGPKCLPPCVPACSAYGVCDQAIPKCICKSGYGGKTCDVQCINGLVDVDGKCKCSEGFTGTTCKDKTCPKFNNVECNATGVCDRVTGKCKCDATHVGDICNGNKCTEVNGKECAGNGTCDRTSGKCTCLRGWKSVACDIPICPKHNMSECNAANNGGTCLTTGKCQCNANFYGDNCGNRSCPKCGSVECGGTSQGTCNSVTGVCQCKSDYAGTVNCCEKKTPQCPKSTSGVECSGSLQGSCVSGSCVCKGKFYGPACDKQDVCPKPMPAGGQSPVMLLEMGIDVTKVCNGSPCDEQTGVCKCIPPASGKACENIDCPKDCCNNGQCNRGVCTCNKGYSGANCCNKDCEKGKNGLQCSNNGTCQVDGRCKCNPKFTGRACDKMDCPDNCSKKGTCDVTTGICTCKDGFGGPSCIVPCVNGKVLNGSCQCDKGFHGDACNLIDCPRGNTKVFCSGHGLCQADGTCKCTDPGYTGVHCGDHTCPISKASSKECNGDLCNRVIGKCVCSKERSGPACDIIPCDKSKNLECGGRGTCSNGICICKTPYTGSACQIFPCPKGLQNVTCSGAANGICDTEAGKCACTEKWQGSACDKPECKTFNGAQCANQGNCDTSGKCVCQTGFGGDACEIPCVKGQVVTDGAGKKVCKCMTNYTGARCDTPACPKGSNGQVCSGNGACDNGTCICKDPYYNKDCEDKHCPEVKGRVCNGQGKCNRNGTCTCLTGFSGPLCDIKDCKEKPSSPTTAPTQPPVCVQISASGRGYNNSNPYWSLSVTGSNGAKTWNRDQKTWQNGDWNRGLTFLYGTGTDINGYNVQTFDTHGSSDSSNQAATNLKTWLSAGMNVAVACSDECIKNKTAALVDAMNKAGFGQYNSLGYRSSYSATRVKNANGSFSVDEKAGAESNLQVSNSPKVCMKVSSAPPCVHLAATGRGFNSGSPTWSLTVDGQNGSKTWDLSKTGNYRGIIAIYGNGVDINGYSIKNFDTHASTDASNSAAAAIESWVKSGYNIALACSDECVRSRTTALIRAMSNAGFSQYSKLQYRESYAATRIKNSAGSFSAIEKRGPEVTAQTSSSARYCLPNAPAPAPVAPTAAPKANEGDKCSVNSDCNGFIPGKHSLGCDKGTCKWQLKDWAGIYYNPSECVGWIGAARGTCGQKAPTPPTPAPKATAGGKCSVNSDCNGFIPGKQTLGCDKGTCKMQLKDWAGVYYNPSECVGWVGAARGTCGQTPPVHKPASTPKPKANEGGNCSVNSDCNGFIPGQRTLGCDKGTCKMQMKDWAGVYYNASECVGWIGAARGTCGQKAPTPPTPAPKANAGGKCSVNTDCNGFIPGRQTLGCDRGTCKMQVKDWAGVYYNPSECVGWIGAARGTCGQRPPAPPPPPPPPLSQEGGRCSRHQDCSGFRPGQHTLACDNGQCKWQVKDWAGVFYIPSECVGWIFASRGTCGQRPPAPPPPPKVCGNEVQQTNDCVSISATGRGYNNKNMYWGLSVQASNGSKNWNRDQVPNWRTGNWNRGLTFMVGSGSNVHTYSIANFDVFASAGAANAAAGALNNWIDRGMNIAVACSDECTRSRNGNLINAMSRAGFTQYASLGYRKSFAATRIRTPNGSFSSNQQSGCEGCTQTSSTSRFCDTRTVWVCKYYEDEEDEFLEDSLQICDEKPCLPAGNPCNGNGLCNTTTGTCVCKNPYYGALCDTKCVNGVYANGACKCKDPYTGATCQEKTCPKPSEGSPASTWKGQECGGRGQCNRTTGKCVCPKQYEGQACQNIPCPKYNNVTCSNRGTCNTEDGVCTCKSKYLGTACEIIKCPSVNGKVCNYNGSCDGSTGNCICNPGFQGAGCDVIPCKKGYNGKSCCDNGTCSNTGVCACRAGYTGETCCDKTCPSYKGKVCSGNACNGTTGTCVCPKGLRNIACQTPCDHGTVLFGLFCMCESGYVGTACDTKDCLPLINGKRCNGHGKCDNGTCKCEGGYSGVLCENIPCVIVNGKECSGNGTCNKKTGKCACNRLIYGAKCDQYECPKHTNGKECNSGVGGECDTSSGKCKCKPQFAGAACGEIPCAVFDGKECGNNGVCNRNVGRCICKIGYVGDKCVKPCPTSKSGVVCNQPNGSCNTNGNGVCKCKTGYGGAACDDQQCTAIDGKECAGNGTCDRTSGKCTCQRGWKSIACNIPVCPKFNASECNAANNGGTCLTTGKCQCNASFFGDNCGNRSCPKCGTSECGGRSQGMCSRLTGVCTCKRGYNTKDCCTPETIPCKKGANRQECSGNGTCDTKVGQCICKTNTSGPTCENIGCPKAMPSVVELVELLGSAPEGICNGDRCDTTTGKCICRPGMTGPACDKHECPSANSKVCNNKGNCDSSTGKCACIKDFRGLACNIPVCQTGPNGKECSGPTQGNCVDGVCKCVPKYRGSVCHKIECPTANALECSGNGTCDGITGKCTCTRTFIGDRCDQHECPKHTNGKECNSGVGGECDTSSGKCKCKPQFAGAACGDIPCAVFDGKECGNNGVCNRNVGRCICKIGYVGDKCVKPCPTSKSGVECNQPNGSCNTNGNGVCNCKTGYGGAACDDVDCPKDKESRPCGGQGVCNKSTGACSCKTGYGGSACDVACVNGTVTKDRKCLCNQGWTGDTCEQKPCPVVNGAVCNNHGSCQGATGTCSCEPAYRGDDCRDKNCPVGSNKSECSGSNQGTCDSKTGTCSCKDKYKGVACDIIKCPKAANGVECGDHGTCVNGVCSCKDRYEGATCEDKPCPRYNGNECNLKGTCSKSTGLCFCNDVWKGAACEEQKCPKDAHGVECAGNGNCNNATGKCVCKTGFSGAICDQIPCPAKNGQVCNSNGTCNGLNGTCLCKKGFNGLSCENIDCPIGRNGAECSKNGVCNKSSGACACYDGYQGVICEDHQCPKKNNVECSGPFNGSCDRRTGTCVCKDTWSGDKCHIKPCATDASGAVCGISGKLCDSGTGECLCNDGSRMKSGELCVSPTPKPPTVVINTMTASPPKPCAQGVNNVICSGRGICNAGKCICRRPYSGLACELKPCPVNANNVECSGNHERCDKNSGKCVCKTGFSGAICDIIPCATGLQNLQCSNHGTCDTSTGKCKCNPNWKGAPCDTPVCPAGSNTLECSGPSSGSCGSDGRCKCEPKFTGDSCSEIKCPTDVNKVVCGKGVCDGKTGNCVCNPGYNGKACDIPDCPKNANGKTCSDAGNCLKDSGRCECNRGYEGSDCSIKPCPKSAGGVECSGNGECDRSNGKCSCKNPWTGAVCDEKPCPKDFNGRVCGGSEQGDCNKSTGVCTCRNRYTGLACDVLPCPSVNGAQCNGHGTCANGKCTCENYYGKEDCSQQCVNGVLEGNVCKCKCGWKGDKCNERECPWANGAECSNNGTCSNGVCSCKDNYTGESCSILKCNPADCNGNGTCKNGTCVCVTGYSGTACDIKKCPSDCSGNGTCSNGVCTCKPQFKGPQCDILVCPSGANNVECAGRGSCSNGKCVCPAGFTGDSCSDIIKKPCPTVAAGECSGPTAGTCDSSTGSCACNKGYAGKACEVNETGPVCDDNGPNVPSKEAGYAAYVVSMDMAAAAGKSCAGEFPGVTKKDDNGVTSTSCPRGKFITGVKSNPAGGFFFYCGQPCDGNVTQAKCMTIAGNGGCSVTLPYMQSITYDASFNVSSQYCCNFFGNYGIQIAPSSIPAQYSSQPNQVCGPVALGTCARSSYRFLNKLDVAGKTSTFCGYTNKTTPTTAPKDYRSDANSPVEEADVLLAVEGAKAETKQKLDVPYWISSESSKIMFAGLMAIVASVLVIIMAKSSRAIAPARSARVATIDVVNE